MAHIIIKKVTNGYIAKLKSDQPIKPFTIKRLLSKYDYLLPITNQ